MNTRHLIILAALAIPVAGLAGLSYFGSKNGAATLAKITGRSTNVNPQTPLARPAPPTLAQMRERVKARVAELNAMTEAQWNEQRQKNPRITLTLQQVRDNATKGLARLEAMTQEEWDAIQKKQQDMMAQRRAQMQQMQQQRAAQAAAAQAAHPAPQSTPAPKTLPAVKPAEKPAAKANPEKK